MGLFVMETFFILRKGLYFLQKIVVFCFCSAFVAFMYSFFFFGYLTYLLFIVRKKTMTSFPYLERIQKAHKLVLQKSTGTPDEFAKRLNISRNSFFRLLDSLREMDAEIGYDKKNTHLLLL